MDIHHQHRDEWQALLEQTRQRRQVRETAHAALAASAGGAPKVPVLDPYWVDGIAAGREDVQEIIAEVIELWDALVQHEAASFVVDDLPADLSGLEAIAWCRYELLAAAVAMLVGGASANIRRYAEHADATGPLVRFLTCARAQFGAGTTAPSLAARSLTPPGEFAQIMSDIAEVGLEASNPDHWDEQADIVGWCCRSYSHATGVADASEWPMLAIHEHARQWQSFDLPAAAVVDLLTAADAIAWSCNSIRPTAMDEMIGWATRAAQDAGWIEPNQLWLHRSRRAVVDQRRAQQQSA